MVSAILAPNLAPMPYESKSEKSDSHNDDDHGIDSNESKSIAGAGAVAPTWESAKASLEARKKRKRPTALLLKSAMENLDRIWMNGNDNGSSEDNENSNDNGGGNQEERTANREAQPSPSRIPASDMDRIRQTTDLLVNVFTKDIHEPAIRALVANDDLKASQMKLTSELETKQKEVDRLKRSEQRSKEAIKKLLKAVTDSAEEAKDRSQSKLVEAKMRADLLHAISERDAAQQDSLVSQRSRDLLSGDVENLKKEKTKLQHDKLRLEREVRSARALADQLSSSLLGSDHHKDDLDYYKGKAKELEIHLQGMTSRLAEKNQEIQELRRYNNRNLSQQKLETLRAAGEDTTTATQPKKSF